MRKHPHAHLSAMVLASLGLALGSAISFTYGVDALDASTPTNLSVNATTTEASDIVLGGANDVSVATFTLRAGREAVIVDTLTLQNCIATRDPDGDCADLGETAGNDAAVASVTISYADSSGATITSTGMLASNLVTFAGETIYVPARGTADVTVTVDAATIDSASVLSGMRFQLNLNAKRQTFNGVGVTTGRSVTQKNVAKNALANAMTLRVTRPTVTLSSASPSGAYIPGVIEALRFNVAANSSGDVNLRGVMFALTATDNSASDWNACSTLTTADFTLANATTGSAPTVRFTLYDMTGTECASSTNDVAYVYARFIETVPAGSAYTYQLSIDTSGASSVTDDALRIDIPSQTTVNAISRAFRALLWSDGTVTGSGITGLMVDNLPMTGGTLVF